MADFNVDIPEVQGGNLPLQPVQNNSAAMAINNVSSTAGGLLNDLFTGRAEQRKLVQQRQIGNALSDQEQKLSAIADAVSSGQKTSAEGRMLARTVTTQAIANNPLLTTQLRENHAGFMQTAGLGQEVAEGTLQEKQQQALISKAADAGFITPDMSPQQQLQASRDWQKWDSAKRNLSDAQSNLEYQTGLVNYQGAKLGITQKQQAITQGALDIQKSRIDLATSQATFDVKTNLSNLATAGLARTQTQIGAITSELAQNVNDPKARDAALFRLNQLKVELAKNTTVDAGGFGTQFIQDISNPSSLSIDNAIKFVNGSITKEQLDNSNSNAVAYQTHLLVADPKVATYMSISDHFKNNAQLLASGDTIMLNYMKNNGLVPTDGQKPADPTPSTPDDKKSFGNYLNSTKLLLDNVTNGKTSKDGNEPAEASNNVANLLKSVPAYSATNDNPSNYNQLVDFLASPSFGKYMEGSGKLNADAADAAYKVLQREYTEGAIKVARDQFAQAQLVPGGDKADAASVAFVPNMARIDNSKVAERISAVPAPGGVNFVAKDNKDAVAVEKARQMNLQVAPIVNRLTRMTAHLQGSRDYQKVYQDNFSQEFTPEPEATPNPNKAPAVNNPQAQAGADLEHMSHAELLSMRNNLSPNDPRQVELAQYEHQAFAREWVKENPVEATASLLAAIPGYTAGKAVGLVKSRTPASLDEMASAYRGLGQGLGLVD